MHRVTLLLLLTMLVACSQQHELAQCRGPALALNVSRWQPSPEQQAEMDRLVSEACH